LRGLALPPLVAAPPPQPRRPGAFEDAHPRIAAARVRYGYPRIHVLLRREGWPVNRKRAHRLYRLEGLSLRRKRPRRHVTAARRTERAIATRPNEQWSMDFVSDALFDGRRIRALTLVDNHTREALAVVVDGGIRGEHVAEAVERVAASRGPPRLIRVDNVLDREGAGRFGQQVSIASLH
jgi:putative transposase